MKEVTDKKQQGIYSQVLLESKGFTKIDHDNDEKTAREKKAQQQNAHTLPRKQILSGVKSTIAIASGKGGVGKSTVAVNLVSALHRLNRKVGILDADIYGPNVPMMFGLEGKHPKAKDARIQPIEKNGIQVMSLGFFATSDTAVIWRGPLVGRAIEQMLFEVAWDDLDILIIDLPPGTGDAQLTLTQKINLRGAILVSTPQDVALSDAVKGLRMFQKVNVPVIGLIENMSSFVCDRCGKEHDIFGKNKVKKAAEREKVPFLGGIPIVPELPESGDTGKPVVLDFPDSLATKAFMAIAEEVLKKL